jgi:hypothetical protein
MSSRLLQQLGKFSGMDAKELPIMEWAPSVVGDMDILIDRAGQWHHEGTAFTRDDLMRLFSRILRIDDGDYYLVTPAEKMRIKVEDAPFIVPLMEVEGEGEDQVIRLITNVGDDVVVSAEHPLRFVVSAEGDVRPYVMVRNGLEAMIGRNVFYSMVDLLREKDIEGVTAQGLWSSGAFFKVM